MRKLFAALFFTDDRARGAVFALTLLTIGLFLWLSLYCAAGRRYFVSPWFALPSWLPWTFWIGALLLILYALVLGIGGLAGLIRALWRRRTLRPLAWLIPAGACLAAGGIGFGCTFPPLEIITSYLYDLSGGEESFWILEELFFRPDTWLDDGFPGLPPKGWAAVFLLSLLLLLAGGLMLAAVFAAAEKRRFRSLFGKATLTLWGLLAVWYVVFFGLALYESCGAAEAWRAAERHFGRPLTAAGLETLYRESGTIDADFWKRQDECVAAIEKIGFPGKENWTWHFYDIRLPDRPTAELLTWYGRLCRENRAAIEAWEACFEQVPPLPVQEFPPGQLMIVTYAGFYACRDFVKMERSRLILALSLGDVETAWACWRRIGNSAAFFRREPFPLGHLAWSGIERMRLDAVEKLLESRLLPDARLDELDAAYAELERAIPPHYERAAYTAAALACDFVMGLEEGLLELGGDEEKPCRIAFAPYRWLFPQFWYHAARDKKTVLQNTLRSDLTWADALSMSGFVPLGGFMEKHYSLDLTARVRGMRTLIRAEKYRRAHGEFPKTLDGLPEDPLTGEPLIYETGPAKVMEIVWKEPAAIVGDEEETTVEAVLVRRRPIEEPEADDRPYRDPTRALIRMRPR